MSELRKEIETAINRCSAENGSNTPDFILAAYLTDCLAAFERAFRWREKWYSPKGVPPSEQEDGPKPPYGSVEERCLRAEIKQKEAENTRLREALKEIWAQASFIFPHRHPIYFQIDAALNPPEDQTDANTEN